MKRGTNFRTGNGTTGNVFEDVLYFLHMKTSSVTQSSCVMSFEMSIFFALLSIVPR